MKQDNSLFIDGALNVARALDRRCKNFDLFCLIAALTVIYGHSQAVAPAPNYEDILFRMTGHNSAATSIAVLASCYWVAACDDSNTSCYICRNHKLALS